MSDKKQKQKQVPQEKADIIEKANGDKIDEGMSRMLDCQLDARHVPIVYRQENNVTFLGLEKLHPFDPAKYHHISQFLLEDKTVDSAECFIRQKQVTQEQLATIHSQTYLKSLESGLKLAQVAEFPAFALFPYFLLKWRFMNPMWYQVGATILGGEIALKYGWSICLSGGMHHAYWDDGGGWCVYSDIPLSIKSLLTQKKIQNAMIIDLDAHQGNGHERDRLDNKMSDNPSDIFIIDVYNCDVYPGDAYAKKGINIDVPIHNGAGDHLYLSKLKQALTQAQASYKPDIIFYNAGTDILEGDPLGKLSVSSTGVIQRDEVVFQYALSNGIPIVMLMSGGYQQSNARVIADSIQNLFRKLNLKTIAQANFQKHLL